jgi:hypothetical protein
MTPKRPAPPYLDLQRLDLDKLVVDGTYQRHHKPSLIARIVANPIWALFSVLDVAGPYPGGVYKIWDGQNRCEALIELGIDSWTCNIVPPDPKIEAMLFRLSGTERNLLRPYEIHRAALRQGDDIAATVQAAVDSVGRTLGSGSKGGLPAVQACYDIVRRWGGGDTLERTLTIITLAWGDSIDAVAMPLLVGLAMFLHRHSDVTTDDELVTRLSRWEPSVLHVKARAAYTGGLTSGTKGHDVYRFVCDIWNERRRKRRVSPIG